MAKKIHKEAELWPIARAALDYARREESAINKGTPDVWGGAFGRLFWIELKDRYEGETLNLSPAQRQLARLLADAQLPYLILWRVRMKNGLWPVYVINTTTLTNSLGPRGREHSRSRELALLLKESTELVSRPYRKDLFNQDYPWLGDLGPYNPASNENVVTLREFLRRQI